MVRNRWFGLFFLSLGVSLIIVDATIVNVAIPSLIADIKINSSEAQWIQETYTLVFASLLLVLGRLADAFGRRRMFQLGVIVFMLSSIAAAKADSGSLLIAARTIQGVGGAMMLPTSLSLLNATFTGRERGIAFAVWGSTIGGTAALGPLLGGWLTTDFSWRWAFGINVPLGLIVLIGSIVHVKESRGEERTGRPDVFGAILSVTGIGAIVFGLIEGRTYGWLKPIGNTELLGYIWTGISPVVVAFAIGAAALIVFGFYERHRNRAHKVALLDISLFGLASFRNGNIAAAIVSLGEFGLLFALPLWLQNALGYSAFTTGEILLALAIGSFLASGMAAPLTQKMGAVNVVRIGIAAEMIGILLIGFLMSLDMLLWQLLLPLFIYGVGVGLATAQLTGVVLAEVPLERGGQASGTASTTRQLGSALGIAILGAVLFSTLGSQTHDELVQKGASEQVASQASELVSRSAGSVIPAWRLNANTADIGAVGAEALTIAAKRAAFTGASFLLIGLVSTFRLRENGQRQVEHSDGESDVATEKKRQGLKKKQKPRSAR